MFFDDFFLKKVFDELFWRMFGQIFFTYNLLTIATFRIRVPLILFIEYLTQIVIFHVKSNQTFAGAKGDVPKIYEFMHPLHLC